MALMLLFYVLLKAILGISSTSTAYVLHSPLSDEIAANWEGNFAAEAETSNGESASSAQETESGTLETEPPPSPKPKYPVVEGFVFLELDGNPFGMKTAQTSGSAADSQEKPVSSLAIPGKKWAVQAASFREKERADHFVAQLKEKSLNAKTLKSGSWYVVRLLPAQATKELAEKQLTDLRQKTGKKGLLIITD